MVWPGKIFLSIGSIRPGKRQCNSSIHVPVNLPLYIYIFTNRNYIWFIYQINNKHDKVSYDKQ